MNNCKSCKKLKKALEETDREVANLLIGIGIGFFLLCMFSMLPPIAGLFIGK